MTTAEGTQLAPFYDLLCTAVYPHLTQKFALKIGGENRSRWLMARHWERFAVEIGSDTQCIAKTQVNLMNRIESALPLVIEELVDIRNDPAGRAMIDKIHDVIMQSIEQMRSRLSDQRFIDPT
ncbi:hypothetical protein [Methylomicrobium lacus]|uniref:hypothetical protein n=1 Tax=Methylomicrobium lacus TaxID=136992 RepID=UPI0035A959C4